MRNQRGYFEIGMGLVLVGMVALIVGLLALMMIASAKEQREWQAFSATHNCKLVATKQGTVSSGIGTAVGANGNVSVVPVTTTTPGQEAFLCDDGVTYWRNK